MTEVTHSSCLMDRAWTPYESTAWVLMIFQSNLLSPNLVTKGPSSSYNYSVLGGILHNLLQFPKHESERAREVKKESINLMSSVYPVPQNLSYNLCFQISRVGGLEEHLRMCSLKLCCALLFSQRNTRVILYCLLVFTVLGRTLYKTCTLRHVRAGLMAITVHTATVHLLSL